MWINVTQKLPSKDTQWNHLNTDMVIRVHESQGGLMVMVEGGDYFEITETKEQWLALVKNE